MSLRTDYTTAFDTTMNTARTAGRDLVLTTEAAAITAGLTAATLAGKKTFTITLSVTYDPADLRLLGPKWIAFKSGVEEAIYSEDIISSEVTVNSNLTDASNFQIDLDFTF